MATTNNTLKDVGNVAYNGILIAAGVIGSRMVTKSIGFKDRPIKFKFKSVGMLALDVAASTYLLKTLQDSKTVPEKIFA